MSSLVHIIDGALSHGPVSEAGKATSSRNALKTGLTGHTVLLSSDVPLSPKPITSASAITLSAMKNSLVQSPADTEWRLRRIPGPEMGIHE